MKKNLLIILTLLTLEYVSAYSFYSISNKYYIFNYNNISGFMANGKGEGIWIGYDSLDRFSIAKCRFYNVISNKDTCKLIYNKNIAINKKVSKTTNLIFDTENEITRACLLIESNDSNNCNIYIIDFDSDGNKIGDREFNLKLTKNVRMEHYDDTTFISVYNIIKSGKKGLALRKFTISGVEQAYREIFIDSLALEVHSISINRKGELAVLSLSNIDTMMSKFIFIQFDSILNEQNRLINNAQIPYNQICLNNSYDDGYIIQCNQFLNNDYANPKLLKIKILYDKIDTLKYFNLDMINYYYRFVFNPTKRTCVYFGDKINLSNGVLNGRRSWYFRVDQFESLEGELWFNIQGKDYYPFFVSESDSNYYVVSRLGDKAFDLTRVTIHFPYTNNVANEIKQDLSYYFISDQSKLFFNISENGLLNIEIYDLLGNIKFYERNKYYEKGKNSISLDFSNYNNGIYFFRITGTDNVSGKFILNK